MDAVPEAERLRADTRAVQQGFLKARVVAFERIVPGVFFAIRSAKPPAEQYAGKVTSERDFPEAPLPPRRWNAELLDYYHGTTLPDMRSVFAHVFRPTLRSGSDALRSAWECMVPGVYVAKHFSTALHYPLYTCSPPHPLHILMVKS